MPSPEQEKNELKPAETQDYLDLANQKAPLPEREYEVTATPRHRQSLAEWGKHYTLKDVVVDGGILSVRVTIRPDGMKIITGTLKANTYREVDGVGEYVHFSHERYSRITQESLDITYTPLSNPELSTLANLYPVIGTLAIRRRPATSGNGARRS